MTQLKSPKPTNGAGPEVRPAGLPCPDSSASFWHSQPNGYLLGHRTTRELPAQADYVIIGSGITGASLARFLCEDDRARGRAIVMLEAREVCWGATGRNGGHCQAPLFDKTPDIAEFELNNIHEVRSYIEKFNIDCEWRSTSSCRTFWDRETFDLAVDKIEKLRKSNPELGKLIYTSTDPAVLKAHRVKPDCSGIAVIQTAGQLWPYKYVAFVVEKLVREGKMNLQTNTPVVKLEGRTVYTERGCIQAKHIILATNGYTSYLLPEFQSLIVPTRCEMSALHPPSRDRLEHSYGMDGGIDPKRDDYLIQRPFYNGRGGHLMFGGGRPQAMYNCIGESDDDIVDTGEADYLRQYLPQMLELGSDVELKASHQWTGIKGYSRDDMPWIGRVRDGVWLCGGYTGHGMPNATLCAKAVVSMLLEGGDYDKVCRDLVDRKELPASYVLTEERLQLALTLPSVWEIDADRMF